MEVLRLNFLILQIIGIWAPTHWSSAWKIYFYNVYSIFVLFVLYTSTLFQGIEVLRSVNNINVLINNSLFFLSSVNACAKVAAMLRKRNEILELLKSLVTAPCCPKDAVEESIHKKCDSIIRVNIYFYGGLIQLTVLAITALALIEGAARRILPWNSWVPYSTDVDIGFWITFCHQILTMNIGSSVNMSFDTLVPGCMIEVGGQFDILQHRLLVNSDDHNFRQIQKKYKSNVTKERIIVAEYVEHHLAILKFAETFNDIFSYTIFIQFSVSLFVLCVTVYRLSAIPLKSGDFAYSLLYLAVLLVQIYLFCFYGTMVNKKSSDIRDKIYNVDWLSMDLTLQKSLLIMLAMTFRPITITSGHIVELSLKSFGNLLKFSYTAYNFLQYLS